MRKSIACHRAVHSINTAPSQHIWISDDLCSRAVTHFFRRVRPHQKRHGSHVPGPLEAQRRAAKRKMTAQANFQHSDPFVPPLFNLGALFASFRQPSTPKWRYEPPSLSNIAIDDPYNDTSVSTLEIAADDSTTTIPSAEEVESSSNLQSQALDTCFAEFKKQLTISHTSPTLTTCASLLHTFNTHRPSATAEAGEYSIQVFRYLNAAQWRPGLIVELFASEDVPLPGIYTNDGLEMLQTVEILTRSIQPNHTALKRFYQKMAGLARTAPASNDTRHDASIRLVIRGLWGVVLAHDGTMNPSTWVYLRMISLQLSAPPSRNYVSRIFESSPDNAILRFVHLMAYSLKPTNRKDYTVVLSEILEFVPAIALRTWASTLLPKLYWRSTQKFRQNIDRAVKIFVDLFHSVDRKTSHASTDGSPSQLAFQGLASIWVDSKDIQLPQYLMHYALLRCLRGHHALDDTLTARLHDFIELYMGNANVLADQSLNESLSTLIAQLSDSLLPNHGVIELMVPLIYKKQGLTAVLDLLQHVEHHHTPLSNTTYLTDLVAQATEHIKQQFRSRPLLTERDRQCYVLILQTCRELREVAARLGATSLSREVYGLIDQRAFSFILERAHDTRIIPLSLQGTDLYGSIDQRVAFIAQLALQYSLDRSRNSSQNWRSIYTLYKYLRHNNQAPGSVFVSAVVRACLMRPLSERSFVSARRLHWVLQLVEESRGQEAARKVEDAFWERRGALIAQAHQKLIESGGQGTAHVRTMKRLGLI
ncbi:hypothetical protein DM02DRAFT_262077 [Periconia macrospinosa]|uniref:Uncharacterized protein n=1 Tax=Periconia macrospinosa TaxID=97972 RepID=A0A2V1DZ73_9PLEO|nr:hypothetical protein DM02DRAFT_262077 [Periconia macrospinosa]